MKEPRMIFGFCVLGALFALAVIVALCNVDALHSFGLDFVIAALALMAKDFSSWAFSRHD